MSKPLPEMRKDIAVLHFHRCAPKQVNAARDPT